MGLNFMPKKLGGEAGREIKKSDKEPMSFWCEACMCSDYAQINKQAGCFPISKVGYSLRKVPY